MAKKKIKTLDNLYSELQFTGGNPVLFDDLGAPSVVLKIINPVQQLSTDAKLYVAFHNVLCQIVQTLGEGYAMQKQDVFCKQSFHHSTPPGADFLTKSYFRFFEGREYTDLTTFLIITQEPAKGQFVKFDPKKWDEFHDKVAKVEGVLNEKNVSFRKLDVVEINEYVHRYQSFSFRKGGFSANNMSASDEYLRIGDKVIRSYPLVDIDEVNIPDSLAPYSTDTVNGYKVSADLLTFLASVPDADCVVYNQLIQIPHQRRELSRLQAKAKRHSGLPDPSNRIAAAEIEEVLNRLAVESSLLVKCHFNIMVGCPVDKVNQVTSFLETKMMNIGFYISKHAYNQLELFKSCFPGRGYSMNPEYELFLNLAESMLCLFYKERMKTDEVTPVTTYYTDRQGLPVCIDITGKSGKVKLTDNSNFFCIGPSGSGKSFHMNSVVRQLIEQQTDVVMVDTGDSYEGICRYFNGTYISYSKEKPISMNPFKVTREEYDLNFAEKKNFLKSLIFLIYKGNEAPTKLEDYLINEVIVEYYEEYFNPFHHFTQQQREEISRDLLLQYKMENKDYTKYSENMEDIEREIDRFEETEKSAKPEVRALMRQSEERRIKLIRQCRACRAIISDVSATQGEKENAARAIDNFKKELLESSYLVKVDKEIDMIEEQKRRLKVKSLSFNTFFEFALERIPQITSHDRIEFEIHKFRSILKPFYKGGEQEVTLNSDLDVNLFDERFIVFEIDKIKDDPVLFPIIVLIIMDVFIQKMRIKKGRKALIIEEAWKAIASPTMAEYIKFLYKTVRKFNGIAGVVTQELNDVIDSPIVKEAIINNSDIKILLDQTKFKDRYDDISRILGLTDVQKQQIFTINSLNNKENRAYFKEVWICRGLQSDVYGVEEPPECYWAYTTERAEKEALKIYIARYGNIQDAISHIEKDRKTAGDGKYLDFATKVNYHKNVMELWGKSD